MQKQEVIKVNFMKNREIEQNTSTSKSLNSEVQKQGSDAETDPLEPSDMLQELKPAATTVIAGRTERSYIKIEEEEQISDSS